jgi:hypothetical protein
MPGAPTTAEHGTPPAAAPAGNGCPANNAIIPTGTGTAITGDVDLDGQPDVIWLTTTPARAQGMTTATGATFSTTFTNATPQAASALGQKLQPAGPAIVLLNTGRSVELHTVVDCQLVPTRNQQGQQYTFDLGFTGYGTGVECIAGSDEEDLSLVGLNAVDIGGDRFRITQTTPAHRLRSPGPQRRDHGPGSERRRQRSDGASSLNRWLWKCTRRWRAPVGHHPRPALDSQGPPHVQRGTSQSSRIARCRGRPSTSRSCR